MSEITNNPSVPSQIVARLKFPDYISNLGIIPTSYKDSMSFYEILAWFCKYLEQTVIPTLNQNGKAVQELQSLYIQLENYCEHYFDNLDVQTEINNKLDEMVESGELESIMNNYIENYLNSLVKYYFPKNYGNTSGGNYTIIQSFNKNILVDCYRADRWEAFEEDLISLGIKHFDYVILTHYHVDHIGCFEDLVEGNYINSNTIVYGGNKNDTYFPTGSTNLENFNEVQTLCSTHGIPFHYDDYSEGHTISVNFIFNIKLYNTDIDYYASLENVNYNACSLNVLITHKNVKTLITGDSLYATQVHLYDVFDKVDLYTIAHHGNETKEYLPFIKQVDPEYSVCMNGNYNYNNLDMAYCCSVTYLANMKKNILLSCNNKYLIEFNSDGNELNLVSGRTFNFSNNALVNNVIEYWVDPEANDPTGEIDGITNKFKELVQAIDCLQDKQFSKAIIHLADGTYSTRSGTNEGVAKGYSYLTKLSGRIEIIGNELNPKNVILQNGFYIDSCSNVYITGVTIYTDSRAGINLQASKLDLRNSIIKKSNDTVSVTSGILNQNNSNLYLYNVAISYCASGIRCSNSKLIMSGSTLIDYCTLALYLGESIFEYQKKFFGDNNTENVSSIRSTDLNLETRVVSLGSEDYTLESNNMEYVPMTHLEQSNGNLLSQKDGGVLIGEGITNVDVSLTVEFENNLDVNSYIILNIRKNNTTIQTIRHKPVQDGHDGLTLTALSIPVTSGDLIRCSVQHKTNAVINGSSQYTKLYVKKSN